MLVTSNEANKLLKNYEAEITKLRRIEILASKFTAATTENIEDARPEYNLEEIFEAISELNDKIRVIKHKINVFNSTTKLPDFEFTIDEALILMPQLNNFVNTYRGMASALPKERVVGTSSKGLVEYTYTNYDIKKANELWTECKAKVDALQSALDIVNNTVKFEI